MLTDIAKQKEVLFITYDQVIKDYRPKLMKFISEHKDVYKAFINTDILEGLSDKEYMGLSLQSSKLNILEYLSKQNFDFDKSLENIKHKIPALYLDSDVLSMGASIHILLNQSFTQKIYIYTPVYDINIHMDIQDNFKDMDRIEYITGPIRDVMNTIEEKITTFILNDIEIFKILLDMKILEYSNILIANLGYNYKLNEENKLVLNIDGDINKISEQNICKIALFSTTRNYDVVFNDK